ncbi:MAG TPA: hypothetical protein VFV63_08215, partial [Ilumatobacteraceae bacterium]|nr:hypothetical protein [Ilumatobacteraceae bacterium]
DRIAVLERGRIVEQGSHDSLIARNGRYRRLSDLQFGHEPAVTNPTRWSDPIGEPMRLPANNLTRAGRSRS